MSMENDEKCFNKRVKTHDEVENKQEDQEMIIFILILRSCGQIKTIWIGTGKGVL